MDVEFSGRYNAYNGELVTLGGASLHSQTLYPHLSGF